MNFFNYKLWVKKIFSCFRLIILFLIVDFILISHQVFSQSNVKSLTKVEINEQITKSIKWDKILFEKAQEAIKEKNFGEAMHYLLKQIQIAPYNYEPYLLLARIMIEGNKYELAFKTIERSNEVIIDADNLYINLDKFDQTINNQPKEPDTSLVSIAQFKNNKQSAISYEFDDGAKAVYTQVLPLFEKNGFRATIPINPGVINTNLNSRYWGSWDDWRDAHKRGFEIANHSFHHYDLTMESDKELEEEINQSAELIRKEIGHAPLSFMFPFNKINEKAFLKVKERHLYIRQHDYLESIYSMVFLPAFGGERFTEKSANHIVEMAIRRNLWVIAECHSIYEENVSTFKPIKKDDLVKHLEYLKSREDKIWVDTTINVFKYLYQKKASNLEILTSDSDHVEFRLKNLLVNEISPLTIIVRPPRNFKSIKVEDKSQNRDITVNLAQDNSIYFDVLPSEETIVVNWN